MQFSNLPIYCLTEESSRFLYSCKRVLYVICSNSEKYTYVGITNNLARRLHQHSHCKAGAESTKKDRPWSLICAITGFDSDRTLRQFEWRLHHMRGKNIKQPSKKLPTVNRRFFLVLQALRMAQWTKTCVPTIQQVLTLYIPRNREKQLPFQPDDIPINVQVIYYENAVPKNLNHRVTDQTEKDFEQGNQEIAPIEEEPFPPTEIIEDSE